LQLSDAARTVLQSAVRISLAPANCSHTPVYIQSIACPTQRRPYPPPTQAVYILFNRSTMWKKPRVLGMVWYT